MFGVAIQRAYDATRNEYLAENDFITNFINDNCIFDINKNIAGKDFIERLKKEYPQAYKFTNKKLSDMVCSIKNISNVRGGKNHSNYFKGVAWIDEAQIKIDLN